MDIYAHFHDISLTNTGLHHSGSISRQVVIAKPGGQRTVSLPQKGVPRLRGVASHTAPNCGVFFSVSHHAT